MTATPPNEPTLSEVNDRLTDVTVTLSSVAEQIRELREGLDASRKELKDEVERWDERFFEFVRDELRLTRTIIIAAAGIAILSPAIQALPSVIQAIVQVINSTPPQ